MTLTTREKKLAVGFLAERAVTAALIKNYGNDIVKTSFERRDRDIYQKVTGSFSRSELDELIELDKLIPKFEP